MMPNFVRRLSTKIMDVGKWGTLNNNQVVGSTFGAPLEIITINNGAVHFHHDNVNHVLSKCDDRPLVIYSVAGDYRKGKSFLLNLFLHFNRHKGGKTDWMQSKEPINGFKSMAGCDRVTSGILLWSEPILTRDQHGQEVAILLMDTQGTFDLKTESAINCIIFGFTIVVSSVTIYNIKDQIMSSDLINLATFAQSINSHSGSFQSLKFVIRDWLHDDRYPFGPDGGQKMIHKLFYVETIDKKDDQQNLSDQVVKTREAVRDLFQSMSCFLLPWPGNDVARNKINEPLPGHLEEEFKRSVDELCRERFVNKLTIRESGGEQWTAETFKSAFQSFAMAYDRKEIADPGTHLEAVTKNAAYSANRIAALSYMEWMEQSLLDEMRRSNLDFVRDDFIIEQDIHWRAKAMELFRVKTQQFGSLNLAEAELIKDINRWLKEKKVSNHERVLRKDIERVAGEREREWEAACNRIQGTSKKNLFCW